MQMADGSAKLDENPGWKLRVCYEISHLQPRGLIWHLQVVKMLPSFLLASWGGKPVPKKSAGGKE